MPTNPALRQAAWNRHYAAIHFKCYQYIREMLIYSIHGINPLARSRYTPGTVFNPQLALSLPAVWHGWDIGISAGPLFASGDYHDYYYSVAPAFAAADRPAFTAHGGYSGTVFILTTTRHFANTWVGAFLRYDNLSGARFEDSPLLEMKHSLMAGVAISYIFSRSRTYVPYE